jgi:hypothetical protein
VTDLSMSTAADSSPSSGSSALPALDPRSARSLARGLGWFSLALGVAELLLPDLMRRATGTPRRAGMLLQLAGLREIAAGVGLLASRDPRPWMWARVGGDALDAATLATQLHGGNPRLTRSAVSLAAVAGIAALDVACARALDQEDDGSAATRDYSGRRGLPLPPHEMRGAALEDFVVPRDMQIPLPLAPQSQG